MCFTQKTVYSLSIHFAMIFQIDKPNLHIGSERYGAIGLPIQNIGTNQFRKIIVEALNE